MAEAATDQLRTEHEHEVAALRGGYEGKAAELERGLAKLQRKLRTLAALSRSAAAQGRLGTSPRQQVAMEVAAAAGQPGQPQPVPRSPFRVSSFAQTSAANEAETRKRQKRG